MAVFSFKPPVMNGDIKRYEWEIIDQKNDRVANGVIDARGPYTVTFDNSSLGTMTLIVEAIADIDGQEHRGNPAMIQIAVRERGKLPMSPEIPRVQDLQESMPGPNIGGR